MATIERLQKDLLRIVTRIEGYAHDLRLDLQHQNENGKDQTHVALALGDIKDNLADCIELSEKWGSQIDLAKAAAATAVTISEDEFESSYTSINAPDGSMIWDDLDVVRAKANGRKLWTVVDAEDGTGQFAMPGIHRVNRVGYLVTVTEWPHENITVELDRHDDSGNVIEKGGE